MKIDELMRREVVSCGIDDSLQEAARSMWEHDCGAIPVVDGVDHVVGVVTDRDICMAAYTQGLPLREIPVTTAMADSVVTLRPDDLVVDATRLMGEQQIRRIPITTVDGRLVGMLTLSDVVREAARPDRQTDGIMNLVTTIAAIGRGRDQPEAAA
jgi:CBS domain-containing protein